MVITRRAGTLPVEGGEGEKKIQCDLLLRTFQLLEAKLPVE
jgi:hypothetical protein